MPLYLFTDINIDLFKCRSAPSTTLLEFTVSYGFQQLIKKASKIQGVSYSLIDHVYTNHDKSSYNCGVKVDSFSDHFSTLFVLDICKEKKSDCHNSYTYRNFNKKTN